MSRFATLPEKYGTERVERVELTFPVEDRVAHTIDGGTYVDLSGAVSIFRDGTVVVVEKCQLQYRFVMGTVAEAERGLRELLAIAR